MEIIIVPILAFIFFAGIVFSLAIALGLRRLTTEHKQNPMPPEQYQAQRQIIVRKAGLILLIALAALALLAILTFSTPT